MGKAYLRGFLIESGFKKSISSKAVRTILRKIYSFKIHADFASGNGREYKKHLKCIG